MKNNNLADRLSPSQLWMIALDGVLTFQNEERYDRLCFRDKKPGNIKIQKDSLRDSWGVENADDLQKMLQWLKEEGRRRSFDEARSFLTTLSEADQMAFINTLRDNQEEYNKYTLVKIYSKRLPLAGIAAWDFGRYVHLCRCGASIDYFTDSEAFDFMEEIAPIAQKSYTSWQEYAISYLAGRQFWLNEITKDIAEEHASYIQDLFLDQNSAWNQIDWNLQLDLKNKVST